MASMSPNQLGYPCNLLLLNRLNRDPIPEGLFHELGEDEKMQSRAYVDSLPICGEDLISFHLRVAHIQSSKAFNFCRHILATPQHLPTYQLSDGKVSEKSTYYF